MFAAFGLVSVIALVTYLLAPSPRLSPEMLRTLAGIGASFFLGFIVEATWFATKRPRREKTLGVLTGLALAGLLGIGIALAAAEHGVADRHGLISEFGLWWSIVALSLLGLGIAIQPSLAAELEARD